MVQTSSCVGVAAHQRRNNSQAIFFVTGVVNFTKNDG